MEMDNEYLSQLDKAIALKQEWFDRERLPQLLESYRLFYSCIKNLNEMLTKKDLIVPDPYKLDRRISEIVVTPTTPFSDGEMQTVLGERISEFETMLDFICMYFRFSTENLTIDKIKKLLELNKVFDWANLSMNSAHCNTRSLATVINQARVNSPAVVLSNITDSLEKCKNVTIEINKVLNEMGTFQKEYIKLRLRKDILLNSEFDAQKAFSSPDEEVAEIKRVFGKVGGKKAFYIDLVNEIVREDQDPNREDIKAKVLTSLGIPQKVVKQEKKGPDPKEMLIQTVVALSGLAPVIGALKDKMADNFDLLFTEKKTFFAKLIASLKKAFGIKEKERICNISVTDTKTGAKSVTRIVAREFLADLEKKQRIYGSFSINGPELGKIRSSTEENILIFLNKQISENQQLFTIINALDEHFKANVEILLRPKVKGLKIDLSSYKNLIVAVNKKRGEYISVREEIEQMEKLGINK